MYYFNILNSLRDIVPENSSWSLASVGRMTVNLRKKEEKAKWPRLLKSRGNPGHMHFWWELHEQYTKELDALKDDDDDDEDDKKDKTTNSAETIKQQQDGKKKSKNVLSKEEKIRNENKLKIDKQQRKEIEEAEDNARKLKTEEDNKANEAKKKIDEELKLKKEKIISKYDIQRKEVDDAFRESALDRITEIPPGEL